MNTQVMHDDIVKCLEVLQNGGIILYPTDTIWGIGCDATNAEAVAKVYALKNREDSKSMLVLMDKMAKMGTYVKEIPEMAWDLVELSEKPMTIIYDGAQNLAHNLIAEDGSIGIRITSETFSHKLIERFKRPIVSTSANISGAVTPQNFAEIDEIIKNGVDYVVQYRQDDSAKPSPSSIIKLGVDGQVRIIRE